MTVANQKDADRLVAEGDGKEIEGRPLKVQIAEPRKEKEPREPKEDAAADKKPKRKPRKPKAAGSAEKSEAPPRSKSPQKPREPREPREFSNSVLFVGNLPFKATTEILQQVFQDAGAVKSTVVKTKTNRSKGFGYVEFKEGSLDAVIEKFSGAKLDEREMVLKRAYIDVKVEQ